MKKILRKISARAFCCPGESWGGNPVTVYMANNMDISQEEKIKLAQACDWESVIVASSNIPRFQFFMPSGEEVSFCAHAAIGAAVVYAKYNHVYNLEYLAGLKDLVRQRAVVSGEKQNEAALEMNVHYTEDVLDAKNEIIKDLLKQIGLSEHDLNLSSPICNASIARNKTLIPINSMEK